MKFWYFSKKGDWITGQYGNYKFCAKVYDIGSYYGINEGRVSKLNIKEIKENKEIVNYDRVWDIQPKNDKDIAAFKAILKAFESLPIHE